MSLLHLLGQQFVLSHLDLLPSSQFLALRNEDRLTYNWQRQSKEFPIRLLHRLERVVRDLQTWRGVGTRWNPGHVYPRVGHVVRVLENRLILGVPECNRSIHVSVRIQDYFVTFERSARIEIYGSNHCVTYTQNGSYPSCKPQVVKNFRVFTSCPNVNFAF